MKFSLYRHDDSAAKIAVDFFDSPSRPESEWNRRKGDRRMLQPGVPMVIHLTSNEAFSVSEVSDENDFGDT